MLVTRKALTTMRYPYSYGLWVGFRFEARANGAITCPEPLEALAHPMRIKRDGSLGVLRLLARLLRLPFLGVGKRDRRWTIGLIGMLRRGARRTGEDCELETASRLGSG